MGLQNYTIRFILFVFSLFVLTFFTHCGKKAPGLSSPEHEVKEYLTKLITDSSQVNPVFVINEFSRMMPEVEDPLEFKKLQVLLSNTYYYANKIDSALLINQEIIDFCKEAERSDRITLLEGDAYNSRAVIFQEINKRDSAIPYFKKAYELLNSISERELLPFICTNLASCYFMDGEYLQASVYYRQALFITDSLDLGYKHHPTIYTGLAQLYQQLEDYDLAEKYFQQAEEYWADQTEYHKYFFANTRGNYLFNIKDYPQALEWIRKANASASTLTLPIAQAITEANLGEIFIVTGENDSARYYLDRVKILMGPHYDLPTFKFYFDGLFASLALLENDLPKAEKLLLQPYDTAFVGPAYIYAHNKRLQGLYEKKQDYKKAYQHQSLANTYNDSLRNTKIRNYIAETAFRFQQDTTLLRKDILLIDSEYKITQWKRATILSIVLFILFASLLVGLILYRRRLQELRHQRQLTTITSLRMEVVRNRLSPHFVFNALNAILPSLDKYTELEQPFRLLIQLLRNNLRASEQVAVSLEEEIKIVKDYLELQAFRSAENITVNWLIDENTPFEAQIPSMSIQIPVENAIKYAFNDSTVSPTIEIILKADNEKLHISIEDNGIGYTPGQISDDLRGTGNGIKMLYKTIDLLNSQNGEKIILRIENLSDQALHKQGTKVSLVVPLNYKFEL